MYNHNLNGRHSLCRANVTGTPLEEFDALQRKLISALHNLISDDIREIQSQRYVIINFANKIRY